VASGQRRVAWVLPGGVDESGVKRVIPALLWQIERLAARHELHVFALAQHARGREYELLGAHVHSLPATQRLARWSALIRGLRAQGPFDVIHAFWAGPSGLLAGLAGRLLRVPVLLSLGGGELARRPEVEYGGQLRRRERVAVAAALRLAARRTVASHFMRTLVLRAGHDADIVPLGVPPALFTPPATPPAHPPWRLLHVASINAVKDQRTLLEAMARIVRVQPHARLDIVGADTLNGAMHNYARSLGLGDFVRFIGWQASADLAAWYRQSHLLVMSSRHEAGPVVALEAAACGVAVVGTRVGHIADWAPDRALAVEVGDAEALAAAVLNLIADQDRRACLATAARAFALAHDADWTAQRFGGLYEELAA